MEINRTPLDLEALEALQQIAGDAPAAFLGEMIQSYFQDSSLLLAAIERAIARADLAEVAQHSHALKGMSATLGARAVANCCLQLENLARQSPSQVRGEQLKSLQRSLLSETELAYQALMAQLQLHQASLQCPTLTESLGQSGRPLPTPRPFPSMHSRHP